MPSSYHQSTKEEYSLLELALSTLQAASPVVSIGITNISPLRSCFELYYAVRIYYGTVWTNQLLSVRIYVTVYLSLRIR